MKQWNKPELLSMGLENTFDLVEPLKKPDIDGGHTDATHTIAIRVVVVAYAQVLLMTMLILIAVLIKVISLQGRYVLILTMLTLMGHHLVVV